MSKPGRYSGTPVVEVRVEPNGDGTQILWHIYDRDGTKSSGFASSPADAMRDAAAFVEAMMQPRVGGLFVKPELKVVS